MKKLFLTFIVFAVTFSAFAQSQSGHVQLIMQNVEAYFRGLDGYVVEAGSEPLIDLGANSKVVPGMIFTVYREGEPIIHPVSGKVLGAKQSITGKLEVVQVFDEYSSAKAVDKFDMKPGDKVSVDRPVAVSIDAASDEIKSQVLSSLRASSVLEYSEDAPFTLEFTESDSLLSCVITQNGNTIYSDSVITRTQAASAENTSITYMKLIGGANLSKGKFISMAVGRVYKGDTKQYLVAAEEASVSIFEISKEFNEVEKLDFKFNAIAAVDIADMDGDGVDEIFVSNVLRKVYGYSSVYKHDGKKFKQVQKEIEFLFRGYTDSEGNRKLLGQKLNNSGGYRGDIFYVDYTGGKYVQGRNVPGTIGKQLLGFALIPAPDENESRMLNIDQSSRLSISTFRKNEFGSTDYFGDTFNRFKPSNNSAEQKNEDVNLNLVIHARPKIIPLDENHFIIVQNELYTRIFSNTPVFNKSNVGIYKLEFGRLEKLVSASDLEPVVVDIAVYEENGKQYLLTLTTPHAWGIFRDASLVNQYEINIAR